MKQKKTLVMGASGNPTRYSYLALNRLIGAGHPVEAIGLKEETVSGVKIHRTPQPFTGIDTVTLYLNPVRQEEYYDYIIGLRPKRVVFNPGTENPEFYAMLRAKGIEVEVACTLVLLSVGQY
ncbi:CoA-binding domain-containing protein [Flavobacterium longum]|uniref:CoA-binding protein n=1 Tax=Flavobacterium longum TaxID=1299340 RepID=UPI0039E824DF